MRREVIYLDVWADEKGWRACVVTEFTTISVGRHYPNAWEAVAAVIQAVYRKEN